MGIPFNGAASGSASPRSVLGDDLCHHLLMGCTHLTVFARPPIAGGDGGSGV